MDLGLGRDGLSQVFVILDHNSIINSLLIYK